jgi:hypothetical protein
MAPGPPLPLFHLQEQAMPIRILPPILANQIAAARILD